MRQRVMIAMALSLGAKVLLADEPTTALDVTVQARILAELKALRDEEDLSILLITHDFGVVADVADRIAVMQAGRIVEQGPPAEIFEGASHPYTRGLLEALRPIAKASPTRTRGAPLLEVEDLRVQYAVRGRRGAGVAALDGVSLSLAAGETLAIVGESGCGKTTLLRSIARLIEPTGGTIRVGGQDLARASRRELAMARRELGMVFQDPQASLNPRRRVGGTLERALRASGLDGAEARLQGGKLIERVGLNPAQAARFPHELSGGERQRVGIARALAGKPRLVLLDEPVSSLDASIRRGAIDLLIELQAELDCAYVLVSHDFTTVEAVADRIAVMNGGKVVETGDARELLAHPRHPYTQELLAACPRIPSLPGGVASEAWLDSEKSREQQRSHSPLAAAAETLPPRSPSSSDA
jgi:peptide/nickel transport system ATP-binding protein